MPDRLSAEAAGYMELAGARKDADCKKVEVKDGVSRGLGCCNEFERKDNGVQSFKCGECEYVKSKGLAARIGAKSNAPSS